MAKLSQMLTFSLVLVAELLQCTSAAPYVGPKVCDKRGLAPVCVSFEDGEIRQTLLSTAVTCNNVKYECILYLVNDCPEARFKAHRGPWEAAKGDWLDPADGFPYGSTLCPKV